MSAFLGPIHHWLFRKIQFQDQLSNRIINIYDKQNSNLHLSKKLKKAYGELEKQPLEDIIDETNIHGWLQDRVSMVECRFACLVTTILESEPDALVEMRHICYSFGQEHKTEDITDATKLFQYFDDLLLDGMPCDRANEIIERLYDGVIWQRNFCVHEQYWNEVGGAIANYYLLRNALINGILDGSPFVYEKLEDDIYALNRRY